MGKRQDILEATLALIAEDGLQSVTFSKIFKRANVGSGTVYNYFKNKEELVATLYQTVASHYDKVLLEGYITDADVVTRFECLLRNMASFSRQFPKEQWFLQNYSHSPYIPEMIRNQVSASQIEYLALIRQGQAQKLIRKMDAALCTQMVNGLMDGAMEGELLERYTLDEAQLQRVLDTCWRAVRRGSLRTIWTELKARIRRKSGRKARQTPAEPPVIQDEEMESDETSQITEEKVAEA